MENIVDVSKITEPIAIFWTGGWDSTYRVVELSRQKVEIQPVYILDKSRVSNERELSSINKIIEMLKERKETLATFLPIDIIEVSEIPENEEITEKVRGLMKEYGWGIQHEWTARVALKYPMIEMCIEKVMKGYMPTRMIIKDHGKLTMSAHGYVVDRENSDDILIAALGSITLPIFETTEVEMLENIKEWGYEDIMANIWFCHSPINGKPCGLCSPCHTKFDSDMGFLLSDAAKKRCKTVTWIDEHLGKFVGKVYRRIVRKIVKK